jgi:hypothetical protein
MKSEPIKNDDLIYDNLVFIDHETLVSRMLEEAEKNSAITLVEFLKKFDYSE